MADPSPETPHRSGAGFVLRADRPDSAAARDLIARHVTAMHAHTPNESVHALDGAELAAPGIRFFTLWDGDTALAMGALRPHGPDAGELKSMHVVAEARGRGAGAAMLRHLIATARQIGLTRLYLETGSGAEFLPARRLYASHGFAECGPYGAYDPDPNSTFMTRTL